MYIIDVSVEILEELGQPTDTSLPAISFWLTTNMGKLNNALGTAFVVNTDDFSLPTDFGEIEKAIFKKMFLVHYYGRKITENLGAAAQDAIVELSSDGATIRTVNKNEIAKSYNQLKKTEEADLKAMIASYLSGAVTPRNHIPLANY